MIPGLSGAPKKSEAPAKDAALIVTDHLVEQVPVVKLTAEYIATPAGDFPREKATELVRHTGGRLFLIHASLPARLEADQVRGLRRNALLAGLFTGPTAAPPGQIPLAFWVLIGGLALGLVIVGAVG